MDNPFRDIPRKSNYIDADIAYKFKDCMDTQYERLFIAYEPLHPNQAQSLMLSPARFLFRNGELFRIARAKEETDEC